jgi:sulfate adenylyltransferase subunit 1 (EFTu-like GTPase family)
VTDKLPPVEASDQFEVRIRWTHPHAMVAGRVYDAAFNGQEAHATVTEIKYLLDRDSGAHLAAKSVGQNEDAIVNLSLDHPVRFRPYAEDATLGSFTLLRAAPGSQHPLAGRRGQSRRARHAAASEAALHLVHRPLRLRQVHHRQPARQAATCHRPSHLPARWRQRAPRPQP